MNEKINRYILKTKFWCDICADIYGSLLNRSHIEKTINQEFQVKVEG